MPIAPLLARAGTPAAPEEPDLLDPVVVGSATLTPATPGSLTLTPASPDALTLTPATTTEY